MHRPPPVQKVLATPRENLAWTASVWALAAMALGGWCLVGAASGASLWLGLAVSVLALAVAVRSLAVLATGQLDWVDGHWLWRRDGHVIPGQLAVRVDLQHMMLLEFRPDAGVRDAWAIVFRHEDVRWLDFRRAAHWARGVPEQTDPGRSATASLRGWV